MLGISSSLKAFVVIVFIITMFLQAFLLLGCLDSSTAYSSVYLTKYSFNDTTTAVNSTQEASIKVGYLNFCVSLNSNTTCTSYTNLKSASSVASVKVGSSSFDLVTLAGVFSDICHSRLLMASIIFTVVSLMFLLYTSVPLMPAKIGALKICSGLSIINALLWGLGTMLQEETVKTAKAMVPPASMYVVLVTLGGRSRAMAWTSFSFILIGAMGTGYLSVKDMLGGRLKKIGEKV